MAKPEKHSRREFLRGRAAVRAATTQAQAWLDTASGLLGANYQSDRIAHVHVNRRAMACEFSVQFHEVDEEMHELVLASLDRIENIETQLTIYRETSDVIKINQQAADKPVEIDDELFELLQLCQQLSRRTAGAFDITSGPLSRAWGFLERGGRLPDEIEIAAALEQVGYKKVVLDAEPQAVRFQQQGVEINFNSIGKGYALDRAAELFEEAGQSDFLCHGGGSSVLARGENRSSRDACWTVGLRNPLRPDRRLAEFHLRDRALATAGGASQFFEHEGKRYSHILDPRTGWPATGVLSATVLADNGALADGLATAFFVLGAEAVEEFCSQNPSVGAVLVCPAEDPRDFAVKPFGIRPEDWTQSQ